MFLVFETNAKPQKHLVFAQQFYSFGLLSEAQTGDVERSTARGLELAERRED